MPHPTPPHFKNNNPRGGGESAAHQKQLKNKYNSDCHKGKGIYFRGGVVMVVKWKRRSRT